MNWDFIPEVFFDFIARLIPGLFVMAVAFIVLKKPEYNDTVLLACDINEAGTTGLIMLALFAYLVGIFLLEVWKIFVTITSILKKCVDKWKIIVTITIFFKKCVDKRKIFQSPVIEQKRKIYEAYIRSNTEYMPPFLKWQAEQASAEVLITGFGRRTGTYRDVRAERA